MAALKEQLTELQNKNRDERNTARRLGDRVDGQLAEVIEAIGQLEDRLMPDQVAGIISNYRFGMADGSHPNNPGMPVHSFDLECGQQVWLHIAVGSDRWDPFVATTGLMQDRDEGSPAEVWNGQRIRVSRDRPYGRYVPYKLLSNQRLGEESTGRQVYVGDELRCPARFGSVTVSAVKVYGPNKRYLEVRRSDGNTAGDGTTDKEEGGNLWLAELGQLTLA